MEGGRDFLAILIPLPSHGRLRPWFQQSTISLLFDSVRLELFDCVLKGWSEGGWVRVRISRLVTKEAIKTTAQNKVHVPVNEYKRFV